MDHSNELGYSLHHSPNSKEAKLMIEMKVAGIALDAANCIPIVL